MLRKDKMKGQMAKRISAFMLATTLCVSACPSSVMAEEGAKSLSVNNGVESPSVDNEAPKEAPKLKGIQILLNGTTITSDRMDLKKGDTVTVRAEIEGEVNVEATCLSVGAEDLLVYLAKSEHGYFEGTAVCEEDLGDESLLFYLNYTIYGSDGLLTKYYKEIGTEQEENNTQDKNETSEIKVKDIQVSKKEVIITDNTVENSDNMDSEIAIEISLDGTFDKTARMELTIGNSDITKTFSISYSERAEAFLTYINHNSYSSKEGTYEIKSIKIDGKEITYDGDKTLFTFKDNVTDKTAPVLNSVQIYVNDKLQKEPTFTAKKGDVIKVCADVTDENMVNGNVRIYGEGDKIADTISLKQSECYLEGQKTIECDNEYRITRIEIFDLNYNGFECYEKDIASFIKNESEDDKETSTIKIKDIQVSKKEAIISDNTIENSGNTEDEVAVTISAEGTFNKKSRLELTFGTTDKTRTVSLYYNESNGEFYVNLHMSGYDIDEGYYKAGTYEIKSMKIDGKEVTYNGDKTLFTLTDNRADKEAPVVNGIQVYVNDKLQTGITFKVKKGDIIKAYVDITDENQVLGGYVTLDGTAGDKTFWHVINLKPSEYDLEGQIEVKEDYEDIEYTIGQIECWDLNENWANYWKDEDIKSLYKEVKVENAGVSKNDTTDKALKDVVSKLDELAKVEGALNESTISRVEQAKKNGKEITANISLSTIPEKSIDSKVKESVQQKAKESLGKDVKLAYLDISLNLMADNSNLGIVNKLLEPIPVTVKLPESLKGNYDYKVVRYHENADGTTEVAILDATKNADGTLTFKTDRFSTYAVAYSEISEDGNSNGNENNNQTENKKPSPITGQAGMMALYITLAVSGVGALVFRKRMQK